MKPLLLIAAWMMALATCHGLLLAQSPVVRFSIDAQKDVSSISRFIYGVNRPLDGPYAAMPLRRIGGNRWTCYNWTNNASNAGADWHFQNDNALGSTDTPGAPIAPALAQAASRGAGIVLTLPINGYVSADKGPPGDVRQSGPDYLQRRFRPEEPFKNTPFTLTPDPHSPIVYQDEFVNWVKNHYAPGFGNPDRPVLFDLDNEPSIWAETHRQVHPQKLTYEELAHKSILYARSIKSVAPEAMVCGPVEFGWSGFVNLQSAPDASQHGPFISYYLQRMAQAEKTYNRRLLDVLDVHWYPEIKIGNIRITEPSAAPAVAAARMQAPRSLWDANYVEQSWITRDNLHESIRLLPRLKEAIGRNYPGTRMGISEYNYGGGADISGAIAVADVLGIFGRSGVYFAAEWPIGRSEPYVAAAFAMYRDYDGHGSVFGDRSISAVTDDVVATSIYASLDSADSHRMVLIAINKSDHAITADINLAHGSSFSLADVYRLTSVQPHPLAQGRINLADPARFQYPMPPLSVSTIVLTDRR